MFELLCANDLLVFVTYCFLYPRAFVTRISSECTENIYLKNAKGSKVHEVVVDRRNLVLLKGYLTVQFDDLVC